MDFHRRREEMQTYLLQKPMFINAVICAMSPYISCSMQHDGGSFVIWRQILYRSLSLLNSAHSLPLHQEGWGENGELCISLPRDLPHCLPVPSFFICVAVRHFCREGEQQPGSHNKRPTVTEPASDMVETGPQEKAWLQY